MEGWITNISTEKTLYPARFYQLWPPDDPENEGHPAGWGGRSGSDGAAQCSAQQWWCSGAGQQWEDHYSRDRPIHLGGEQSSHLISVIIVQSSNEFIPKIFAGGGKGGYLKIFHVQLAIPISYMVYSFVKTKHQWLTQRLLMTWDCVINLTWSYFN